MKKILISFFIILGLGSCRQMGKLNLDGSRPSYLSDLFGQKKKPPLVAPSSFHVSSATYADRVHLEWRNSEGVSYYIIEKSEEESGPFIPLGNKVYSTNYDDFKVEQGKSYWYRVRGYSRERGEFTPYSLKAKGYILDIPKRIKASKGSSIQYIDLSWNRVEGAAYYDIYKSNNKDAGVPSEIFKTVSSIETSTRIFIDEAEQGKEIYFWVKSRNRYNRSSNPSFYSMGFSLTPGAPAKPKNTRGSQGLYTDKIEISWDYVSVHHFDVYRWSELNSQEELISPEEGVKNISNFIDDDIDRLKLGVRYFYGIQAVTQDENDNTVFYKGAFSDPVEAYLLAAPQTFKASWRGDDISLDWKGVPGAQNEEELNLHSNWNYLIYRASSASGSYTNIATISISDILPTGHLIYLDKSVSGKAFYKIKTVNSDLIESEFSFLCEAVPESVVTLRASQNEYKSSQKPNSYGVFPVSITWTGVKGASSYEIFRCEMENGQYESVGDPVLGTSFFDQTETRQSSIIYYYRIQALNSLDQRGDLSAPVSGYGALTNTQFLLDFNKYGPASSHKKLTYMHNSGTGALGSERKIGTISGYIDYNATLAGLGANVFMKYTNYCDLLNSAGDPIFMISGNSNTSANMSANGTMNGTITVSGMYPGSVGYDSIIIKGGAAKGGTYKVTQVGRSSKDLNWAVLK